MDVLFPAWHLVGVGQGFLISGGCSLWVASFGSNRSASPVKRYLRWSHILCSFSLGELRMVWENRGTEPLPTAAAVSGRSARSLRYLCSTSIARITNQSALTDGLRLAGSRQRFRPKEAKLHGAISESADEPQTLLRDIGISDGHSMICLICLGLLADQSHIIRCVRRGAYSG